MNEVRHAEVFQLIKNCGRKKIKSARIEEKLCISGGVVRAAVKSYRRAGKRVCSDRHGYWIGTPNEVLETIDHLSMRKISLDVTIKQMLRGLKKRNYR